MEPDEIEKREFLVSLRGYDRDEVDSFAKEVSQELRHLRDKLAAASADAASSSQAPIDSPPRGSQAYERVGEDTSKILLAAEQVGEQIREKARREASELMTDARTEAEKAKRESDSKRQEAEDDLRKLREARTVLATQLEDVGQRLNESVARLRAPVEPAGPAARTAVVAAAQAAPSAGRAAAPAPTKPPEQASAPAPTKPPEQASAPIAAPTAPAPTKAPEAPARSAAGAAAQAPRTATEPAPVPPKSPRLGESPSQSAPTASAPSAAKPVAATPVPTPTPAKTPEQSSPAASAPSKGEDEGASLARLLQQIRTERDEGRKEVDEALKSGAATASSAKAPEVASPEPAPKVATVEPAAPKLQAAPAVAKPPAAAKTDGGMLARRDDSLGDVPEQASRRLKRLLQEDQNDLLHRVRTQRGKGSVEENLIPELEHLERFKQGLDDSLRKAFSTGRSLGGAADPGDATSAIANLVGKQLVGPLRVEIAKTIEAGLGAEESANSLGERASDVFRVWKGVRTELLGEGMVYAAFHQGLIDAWKSSAQKQKQWILSSDEMECPKDVCKANADAGPVALDAGFPSGHLAPPAHGGCSCTMESPSPVGLPDGR